MAEGAAGIRRQDPPRLLSVAAEEWFEAKKLAWSPGMSQIAKNSLAHILPELGRRLIVEIEASHVAKYQRARLAEGAANRTVNIEVSTLRQIMRRFGTWARIQSNVSMLPEREDIGRALTSEEESALLFECGRSRSRILLPFVLLALETGARYNTIRTLQWSNIDFANCSLKFGKDKTAAGTGRTVPLSRRAVETLKFWAQQFPGRKPEHYVFPTEKVGAAGDRFDGKVYDTDPTNPVGAIKEAWETAKRRTRRHCPNCNDGILVDRDKPQKGHLCESCNFGLDDLPAGLVNIRFHDLRHTFVSRAIASRVPLPIIAKIVGWSAGTLAKMSARYGHFGIEELRAAVEAVSGPAVAPGYPQFSPQSRAPKHGELPN
ncbi:MAG TPA: integrase [Terriglobales bacterium]|nr:integrase [Terriglobales bacterium]